MFDGTTNFPQAIGVAATFNENICEEMADIIGKELNAIGCNQTLAPLLDVTREPRWGRLEETFGEDVYLVSQMGILGEYKKIMFIQRVSTLWLMEQQKKDLTGRLVKFQKEL